MTENELRQRVDELEQQLAALTEEKRAKMSRRDLLAAGGMLAGGSILGGAATKELSRPASAASPTGQVDANVVDTNSLNTEQLSGADIANATAGQVMEAQGDGSLGFGSPGVNNGITYVLPGEDLQAAFDSATDGDAICICPGQHDITSTLTVNNDLTILWYGTLTKQADVVAARFNGYCNILATGSIGPNIQVDGSAVSDTTDAVVFHAAMRNSGLFTVADVGGHGVFFHQDSAGHSTNDSQACIRPIRCGGDGVRIENTSGNAPNLNNMNIVLNKAFECTNGLHILHGFGNRYIASTEANSNYGVNIGGNANRQEVWVTHNEGNTNGSVFIDSAATANYVHGDIGTASTVTNNAPASNLVEYRPNIRKIRTEPNIGAADLDVGEVAIDGANSRLCWKEAGGEAWYAPGTSLS